MCVVFLPKIIQYGEWTEWGCVSVIPTVKCRSPWHHGQRLKLIFSNQNLTTITFTSRTCCSSLLFFFLVVLHSCFANFLVSLVCVCVLSSMLNAKVTKPEKAVRLPFVNGKCCKFIKYSVSCVGRSHKYIETIKKIKTSTRTQLEHVEPKSWNGTHNNREKIENK